MTPASILQEHPLTTVTDIPRDPFVGADVWTADTLNADDGMIGVPGDALDEMEAVVATLRDNPMPIAFLEPAMFAFDACAAMMRRAGSLLREGVGFVIIDRLPLERWTKAEATAVYWLLARQVSRPVAQSWDGKMLYDVRDLGRPPGNGVRPDVTNAEQNFHTDNSYNLCAPDFVALLCLRTARQGGVSSIVNFQSVINALLRSHPDCIERLFHPWLFDRQREHAPDAPTVISHPLMRMDAGRLSCRLSHRHVVNGYRMADQPLAGHDAQVLATLEAMLMDRRFIREFVFEPGQIQIVDNRRLGHRRTGFVDFEDEDRKRHLVRLWLRDAGRRFYNG